MPAPNNPRYLHITANNRLALTAAVDPKLADNVWHCVGAPFWDGDMREWVQVIERTENGHQPRNGEVNLREVKRR